MGAIAQPALTASTTASILLALLGALLFAVSAALQHHAVGIHARQLTSVAQARDPLWLLGWVANLAGFAAQAAALHLGSIVIVQAHVLSTVD